MTEMSVDASMAQWLTTGFTLVNAIMIPITAFLTIDVQLRTSEHRSMYSYVRLSIDRCTATYV